MLGRVLRTCARWALDVALPPRCAECGVVASDVHSFCADYWKQVEFLGQGGCATCGMLLRATDIDTRAACLAKPLRITRTRAAVAYDELSRSVAIRLKYARKVAAAKTMARSMLPLVGEGASDRLLVPVPLHRTPLWWRGLNQLAQAAHELAKGLGIVSNPFAVKRAGAARVELISGARVVHPAQLMR